MDWQNQPTNILNCSLPLELISFEAVPKAQQVELKWATSFESNTAFFDVERSADGRHFDLLGTVPAAGFSQTLVEYTYVDDAPIKG
ncbi:MAG: hypothetical protein IPG92_07030 [Flavobacteriales bacterium]|nr:hypothetical protein [Flavobacteriales bacterium]